ncbi:MAG: hypothetical protein A2321_00275 [Omnitrophica WOR_2 bacterium RIFOXYB2_FULL_45_11]|nr:MAG: hypothetical protein A2321_00275 [Omnitrophica WOR_2 bacterium RIFOXYB2_FULL_45_11]OGX60672.1 MAG: hypothetical protein A2471_03415 [Omnitrophica WOR_2 bacterium RIFOXYC2_FULL_45_15]
MIKGVKSTGIRSWPEDDRPREKLLKKGAHVLSNSELLAILLRTGTKGTSAIDLARKVLKKVSLLFPIFKMPIKKLRVRHCIVTCRGL